jgi:hypothetical protein
MPGRTPFSDEELDKLLRQWKRKGVEKVLGAQFLAALGLGIVLVWYPELTVESTFYICVTIFLGVGVFISAAT